MEDPDKFVNEIDNYFITNDGIFIKKTDENNSIIDLEYDEKLNKWIKTIKTFPDKDKILKKFMKLSDNKYINVKIFKNGSLQMTGIKKISECNIIINKLLDHILLPINSNTITEVYNNTLLPEFITSVYPANTMITFIEIIKPPLNVTEFNIRMINSNCKVPFKVNRDALFQLLKKDKVKCRYDPNSHACVNIRYDIKTGQCKWWRP